MDRDNRLLRVLLVYNKMIPSIRLCAYTQLEALSDRREIEYRAVRYISVSKKDLQWADVLIMGRSDSWYEFVLADKAHKAGKHIAYIMDDDLLNVPCELSSAAYLNRKDIRRNIERLLDISDVLISPSPILLERYGKEGGRLLVEEPAICPVRYMPRDPGQPLRIGFAGSIDRTNDIQQILSQALLKIKAEYGDSVSFSFYGAIPAYAEALGAETLAYCDTYERYRETLNALRWDIGLAPMPRTPFHACKHYNKFVEYAASGIVGVYSETQPYLRLKKWENCGLFCNNTAEAWYEAIKTLLDDPEKLDAMRRQVCDYSAGVLSVDAVATEFLSRLRVCTATEKQAARKGFLLAPYKLAHFFVRGYHFLQNHRRDLLPAIREKLTGR